MAEYNRYSARSSYSLETPNGHMANMSTPPHTSYLKRPHLPHITPIRVSDAESRALLMLPAFSSPQPPMALEKIPPFGVSLLPPQKPMTMAMVDTVFPAQPTYEDEAAENSVFEYGQRKKKQKKARREVRDVGFSLDSSEKPPYSYATLIGMAILSHPDKQLTLSQIYMWISDTFKYYRQGDVGWQNLIRHNLSLNKAFVKGEKSKDGKGHFWLVQKESMDIFLKAKNNKRSLYDEVMEQLAATNRTLHGNNPPLSPSAMSEDDMKNYKINNHTIVNKNYNGDVSEKVERSGTKHSALRSNSSLQSHQNSSGAGNNSATSSNNSNRRGSVSSDGEYGDGIDLHSDDATRLIFRTPIQENKSQGGLPERPILAGKNSPFTLSFSCSLNFEFLPVPPVETGPLLEPLTPGRPSLRPYTNNDMNVMSVGSAGKGLYNGEGLEVSPSLPPIRSRAHSINMLNGGSSSGAHIAEKKIMSPGVALASLQPSHVSSSSSISEGSFASTTSADSSATTGTLTSTSTGPNTASVFLNLATGVNSAGPYSSSSFNSSRTPKLAMKTPLRLLKTPLSGTVVRKLWQSPSYLEDFYHSPFGNERAFLKLYDDDDMILRAFDSPAAHRKRPNLLLQFEKIRTADSDEKVSAANLDSSKGELQRK